MAKQRRQVRSQAARERKQTDGHLIAERQGEDAGWPGSPPGSLRGRPFDAQVAMLARLNAVQRRAEVQAGFECITESNPKVHKSLLLRRQGFPQKPQPVAEHNGLHIRFLVAARP